MTAINLLILVHSFPKLASQSKISENGTMAIEGYCRKVGAWARTGRKKINDCLFPITLPLKCRDIAD